MAVDERRRQEMYRKLEELLGPDEAGTLMEYLPPAGWGDIARRSDMVILRGDVDSLRRDMDILAERLSDRFDAKLESKLNSQTKTIVGLMTAQVLAVAGLAFAAARFA